MTRATTTILWVLWLGTSGAACSDEEADARADAGADAAGDARRLPPPEASVPADAPAIADGGGDGGGPDVGTDDDAGDPPRATILRSFAEAEAVLRTAYCERMAEAACAAAERCGCAHDAIADSGCVPRAVDRCMERAEFRFEVFGGGLDLRVLEAEVERQTDQLRRCVPYGEVLGSHLAWIDGQALGGGTCFTESGPCAGGAGYCRFDHTLGSYQCVTRPAPGDACTAECGPLACVAGRCVERAVGSACGFSRDCLPGDACRGGICTSPSGLGDACSERGCVDGLVCASGVCALSDPTPCSHHAECAIGERCGAPSFADVCRPRAAEGGHCDLVGDCAVGLSCDLDTERCSAAAPIGSACAYDVTLCAGGYCDTDSVCVARGAAGDPCDTTDGSDCAGGLACIAGLCAVLGEPGAPCDGDADCVAGAFCDEERGACALRRATGSACMDDGACSPADWCDPGGRVCRPRALLGEACGPTPCAEGSCGRSGHCIAGPAHGERCGDSYVCDGGIGRCREEYLDGSCSLHSCFEVGRFIAP